MSLQTPIGPIGFAAYHSLKVRVESQWLRRVGHEGQCRIIVGSGGTNQPGWIPTGEKTLDLLEPGDWKEYFGDHGLLAVLAEHVWEHLTPEQGLVAAKTCFRFLTPGGYLRIAVPDGFHPNPDYIDSVRPGGTGLAADDHKVLFDYHSLSRLLTESGFEVDLLEYYDEDGEFHHKDWRPQDGMVWRSKRFLDPVLVPDIPDYTSLIIDARKSDST